MTARCPAWDMPVPEGEGLLEAAREWCLWLDCACPDCVPIDESPWSGELEEESRGGSCSWDE